MPRTFVAQWLGRRAYGPVHELQKRLMHDRFEGRIEDTLLMVEHEPVITMGSSAEQANIVASESELAAKNIHTHAVGRGGDVTYHGPGQLVVYPIFDLKPDRCDVRRYVRDLGRVMELLAEDFGVGAGQNPGFPGCWVDAGAPLRPWRGVEQTQRLGKIGAVGVRLSRWITMHGFAFNARTDLTHFACIVPCGIKEHPVVTLESLGVQNIPSIETLAWRAVEKVEQVFEAQCRERDHFTGVALSAALPSLT